MPETTDPDVYAMYQWLLARPPENEDTVRAFRTYYPDLETGRRAILASDEFRRSYAALTQVELPVDGAPPAVLAEGFLRRAGGSAPVREAPARDEMRQGMLAMLSAMGFGHGLALIVGQSGLNLDDWVPLHDKNMAILHVAPGFPHFVPWLGRPDGHAVFRISLDAEMLLTLLRATGLRIGLVLLLEHPAGAAVLCGLRGMLAAKAIIGIARDSADFDTAACLGAIDAWPGFEPLPDWLGLRFFHTGGWHLPVAYAPTPASAPNAEEYPALAIACIARNERNSIGHMLQSCLPVASFVAMLDTGSTDDTLDQARQILAASGKPFNCERRALERFDDMRNTALALVPDWVEFVLMLDADEALAPEDYVRLLDLLRRAEKDAYALPRYNYIGQDMRGQVTPYPDRQIRLLRHRPERPVRYAGAVHETVYGEDVGTVTLDAAALGLSRGGPHIHHLVRRFRTPEEEASKQAHYQDLAARLGG